MNTLRGIHRWLDALSERTKIVGLLVAIAVGLALVAGIALVDAREGESAAVQDAYDNGFWVAQSLNDGLSSRSEITSACSLVLSAADASNQGVEATYTSEQAAAFHRGCEDGAPATTASPSSEIPPGEDDVQQVVAVDGSIVPPEAVGAYEEGKAVGVEIRGAIAAGLTGTYAEGENGPQRFFEDATDERNPYPDRSDDVQNYFYELGAWEQSGLYDGPGTVVYEGN